MNFFEKAIAFISPASAVERAINQERLRAFDAGSRGPRTGNWRTQPTDANADIARSGQIVMDRSRDLFANNSYYKRGIRALADDIIGIGIRTAIKNERVRKEWNDWTKKCDYDGHDNFYAIQKLVFKTVLISGECIVIRRQTPAGLELQVVEPDYLDRSKDGYTTSGGGYIKQGIEYSAKGKVVAYWLYEEHPGGDSIHMSTESVRFSKDRVMHIFQKDRPGQSRGLPNGMSTMIRLRDLAEYEDAEQIRKKVASSYAGFVYDSSEAVDTGNNQKDTIPRSIFPGNIEMLPPGKQITFNDPPTVDGFEEYNRATLRSIAGGHGVPYESISNDYSQSNYSASRLARTTYQGQVDDWRWLVIIPQFCEKVWEWFRDYHGINVMDIVPEWTTPALPFVDPVKEIQATEMAVRAGLKSQFEAMREGGFDPEDVMREMAEYKKMAKKYDLITTLMPEYFQQAGPQPQAKKVAKEEQKK